MMTHIIHPDGLGQCDLKTCQQHSKTSLSCEAEYDTCKARRCENGRAYLPYLVEYHQHASECKQHDGGYRNLAQHGYLSMNGPCLMIVCHINAVPFHDQATSSVDQAIQDVGKCTYKHHADGVAKHRLQSLWYGKKG